MKNKVDFLNWTLFIFSHCTLNITLELLAAAARVQECDVPL